ncbi:MAG: hypothetical protein OXU53_08660 [Deltaproteobacteria bacterium]|nr:hypothetical protein [Deltaproteobacteria bacterium]MDD9871915.1 hypothetical protein [Deltaproteobacteria bacterium]
MRNSANWNFHFAPRLTFIITALKSRPRVRDALAATLGLSLLISPAARWLNERSHEENSIRVELKVTLPPHVRDIAIRIEPIGQIAPAVPPPGADWRGEIAAPTPGAYALSPREFPAAPEVCAPASSAGSALQAPQAAERRAVSSAEAALASSPRAAENSPSPSEKNPHQNRP